MSAAHPVYVYCLFEGPPPPLGDVAGIGGEPIRYVECQGIRAAISWVLDSFPDIVGAQGLAPLHALAPLIVAHERVVEAIMGGGTGCLQPVPWNSTGSKLPVPPAVLPMRFGCVFSSEEAARQSLQARHEEFRSVLDRLGNKKEFGIRVCCTQSDGGGRPPANWALPRQRGPGECARERAICLPGSGPAGLPAMANSGFDETSTSGGRAYFRGLQAEKKLRHEARQRLVDALQAAHERLAAHAVDYRVESCESIGLPQNSKDNAREVFRAAYLVPDLAVPEFLEERVALEPEFGPKLGLKLLCTGPWPPYHFVEDAARTIKV